MSRKIGKRLYFTMGVVGIVAAVAVAFFPAGYWNASQRGTLIGIGAGLFGFGIAKWCLCRWGEKNPDLWRQNEIEQRDERNQLIRSRAQAISGEILHWLLMVGAWIGIFLDAPMGVTLLLVGVFVLKTLLDCIFTAYYRRKM